jgi:hypothetical protein
MGIGIVPSGAGRRAGFPGGNFDWQFVKISTTDEHG